MFNVFYMYLKDFAHILSILKKGRILSMRILRVFYAKYSTTGSWFIVIFIDDVVRKVWVLT